MGLANKILPHYTYNEYQQWEGRWELIEGHPIAISPSPTPKHQRIASALNASFFLALKELLCKQCRVYDPLDYKISEDTIVQPDILIVCDEIKKPYLDFAPALVVEILSPSTALRDRHTKFELYKTQGIHYYLIVDADEEKVEIYELKDNEYHLQVNESIPQFTFLLQDGCNITPDFSDVWN